MRRGLSRWGCSKNRLIRCLKVRMGVLTDDKDDSELGFHASPLVVGFDPKLIGYKFAWMRMSMSSQEGNNDGVAS